MKSLFFLLCFVFVANTHAKNLNAHVDYKTPSVSLQLRVHSGEQLLAATMSYNIYCDSKEFKLSHLNPVIWLDSDFSFTEPSGKSISKGLQQLTVSESVGHFALASINITGDSLRRCDRVNLFYDLESVTVKNADGSIKTISAAQGELATLVRQNQIAFDIKTDSSFGAQSYLADLPFFNAPVLSADEKSVVISNSIEMSIH